MIKINPFDYVNKNDVRKSVAKLRRRHPQLSNRELCELIVKNKSRWCAGSGAVTSLPGVVPGLGTLVAVFGGTALDVTAVSYFMTEMILQMAAVYGRDLHIPGVSREALWVFMSAVGTDAVGKGLSKAAVKQLSRQAFVKIIQDLLLTLGIRTSQRTVFRILPLVGSVLCGIINYHICKKIGLAAARYYDSHHYEEWEGITVDAEAEVE